MFPTNDPYQKDRRKSLRNNLTAAEKFLWEKLRNRQLGWIKFRRQFWVWPYILDFYSPEKQLCIEIDGDLHSEIEAQEYDKIRTKFLNERWIKVIRYTNHEVYANQEWVLEDIIKHLENTPPNLP